MSKPVSTKRGAEEQAVTANRLTDGAVVWQTQNYGWSLHFADAAVHGVESLPQALDRANVDAEARIVVEPYAIAVTRDQGVIRPKTMRERVRAKGPSVRPDLNVSASENAEISI